MLAQLLIATAVAASPGGTSIEEVVVVATVEETIPVELARFGNRVEVITAEEIDLGGFDDLAQTLQMRVPGLYLAPKNGAFDYTNCSLQGSRCQDILWLIDGVRINNRLYNSTSPLDTVPAHMIERVEVLYGGQGIFYGTQSVGGVVNVVTKGFTAPEGGVSVGFDGNDGVHLNAAYATEQLVVYGSFDEADGFQPFRDSEFQPSGTDRDRGYEVATIGAKYRASLSDAGQLTLMYHRTDNEVEWASPANRARSYNERIEDLVTAKVDWTVNENVKFFAKAYYHDWDSNWTRRDNELDAAGALTGRVVTRSDGEYWGYEDFGVTAVASIAGGGGFDYAVGYDHHGYSGRDDVLLIADDTEYVNALFAQVRTNAELFENTRLAFGVRANRPSGDGDINVWNLSGQHTFNESLYARFSAGTSFRFPDAWQLYGNDPCCTQGNPDLEGEESQNVNVALGGSVGEAHWELIAFTREIENLIGSANGVRINSDASVDFDGFEVSLAVTPSEFLAVGLDHTRTTAEAAGSSLQVTDIPESITKLTFDYQAVNLPLEITASIVRVGDLFDSVSGGIGRVEHGGYTVIDVGAAYYLGADRQHRLGLRLENLLDEDYGSSLGRAFRDVDGSSYAYTNLGTPRTLHGSYRYRF